jgi:hypothetical protein
MWDRWGLVTKASQVIRTLNVKLRMRLQLRNVGVSGRYWDVVVLNLYSTAACSQSWSRSGVRHHATDR